ncbi:TonB-dependent siderophore receptor [Sphingomonas sp. ID0503]|uniref:TonB-dependent siderophore receptor n=1 Tax=Sphingomonas sp. ID0503 TaxID=3399691 RepID=UPI003AFB4F15
MKPVISGLMLGAAWMAGPALAADAPEEGATGDIIVTGVADPHSAAATGLKLTLSETPQSVTIVDPVRIRDFRLTNVNALLDQVVGINVQRNETDRTEYTARGFNITNFQVDGIGLPLLGSGIQFGDLDTILFDRVEVVRGADAMMTGIGNPSATVSFVRKRPLDTFRATVTGEVGSWDERRIEADVSVPLTKDGTLSARAIVAHEERDSHLNFNHVNRDVYAGLIAWSPVQPLRITLGYARQRNEADGVLWGAIPLIYTDGGQADLPRSTSTAQPWTYRNVTDETAFGEAALDLGGEWSVRGVFTYRHVDDRSKLLYATGLYDRDTGLGVDGMTGIYPSDNKQYLWDAYASGPFSLFGRKHQLAFGFSAGRGKLYEYEAFSDTMFDYPSVYTWDKLTIPEPDYPEATRQTNTTDRLTRAYGAAHIDIADPVKAVVGASVIWLKSTGESYGTNQARKNSKVAPYAGLTVDVADGLKLYASYTDIFNPQIEVDVTRRKLDPAKGTSVEGGVKATAFGGRLYATAAVFRSKQKGLAEYAGSFDDGKDYYVGVDTKAKGVEFEIAGQVTTNWTVNGGVTFLSIKDEFGDKTRTFAPRRSLKLASSYQVPEWRNLKAGVMLRAQSRTANADDTGNGFLLRQKGFTVVDLFAGINVLPDRLRASVNVDNVFDKKYLNSLAWGQAFYAAPRGVRGSLSFIY